MHLFNTIHISEHTGIVIFVVAWSLVTIILIFSPNLIP